MIDRRLRVLRVVADRGTISAAAADLGYTPSALSHQLRTLSRDVGARLLEPVGRNVRLTRAARLLLERSDDLFAHWEQIRGEVQQVSGGGLGHLRLAGFSTAASTLFAPVAVAVRDAFPDAEVTMIEAEPEVCFELLQTLVADVAVVVTAETLPAADDPRFEQIQLMSDPLDLLVPAGHRLATAEAATLADARDEPWILDKPGGPYHRLAMSACLAAGFTPRQVHRIVEWDTCAALVGAGFAVALVPRLARLPADDLVVRVPLHGADAPVRHVRMAVRRGTATQPEIALALRELRRVAGRVAARGHEAWHQESLDV